MSFGIRTAGFRPKPGTLLLIAGMETARQKEPDVWMGEYIEFLPGATEPEDTVRVRWLASKDRSGRGVYNVMHPEQVNDIPADSVFHGLRSDDVALQLDQGKIPENILRMYNLQKEPKKTSSSNDRECFRKIASPARRTFDPPQGAERNIPDQAGTSSTYVRPEDRADTRKPTAARTVAGTRVSQRQRQRFLVRINPVHALSATLEAGAEAVDGAMEGSGEAPASSNAEDLPAPVAESNLAPDAPAAAHQAPAANRKKGVELWSEDEIAEIMPQLPAEPIIKAADIDKQREALGIGNT